MRKYKNLLLVLPILFLACEDILEEDISEEIPFNLSPEDGDQISGNTVNFSWETIVGAEYRLQVLRGFNNSRIILDTLIPHPYFSANLLPNNYMWRLRGENSAYNGPFTDYSKFNVIFSEDLSIQEVILETPTDKIYINHEDLLFTWSELSAAESYIFKLQKSGSTGMETIEQATDIIDNFYKPGSDLYVDDAEYVWSVKGANDNSSTDFSSRTFYLDRSKPGKADLVSPEDDQSFGVKSITFTWNFPPDLGTIPSAQSSVLEISSDVDFENIIERMEVGGSSATYSFGENGAFYWRIQISDEAENLGPFSDTRSVILK